MHFAAGSGAGLPNPKKTLTMHPSDSGALASLVFGDGENYIKKDDCKGGSFDVGAVVEYQGKQCKVSQAVDDDGDMKVKFPAATLETSMTEADISGLKLGAAGAIIAAAFLPKW